MEKFFAVIIGCRAYLATNFCLSYPVPLVWNDKRRGGRKGKQRNAGHLLSTLFLQSLPSVYFIHLCFRLFSPPTLPSTDCANNNEVDSSGEQTAKLQPQVNCPQIALLCFHTFQKRDWEKGGFCCFPRLQSLAIRRPTRPAKEILVC